MPTLVDGKKQVFRIVPKDDCSSSSTDSPHSHAYSSGGNGGGDGNRDSDDDDAGPSSGPVDNTRSAKGATSKQRTKPAGSSKAWTAAAERTTVQAMALVRPSMYPNVRLVPSPRGSGYGVLKVAASNDPVHAQELARRLEHEWEVCLASVLPARMNM